MLDENNDIIEELILSKGTHCDYEWFVTHNGKGLRTCLPVLGHKNMSKNSADQSVNS